MSSKAAKLKNKRSRGRPKAQNVAREPNGRISRSGISHPDAHKSALEAKAKHLGLTIDQVKDQKAATFIGYLNILGRTEGISDDQYDALTRYQDLRRSYLLAIKAPDGGRNDDTPGAGSGEISEDYVDWCKDTIETYDLSKKAIQEAQNYSRRNLWGALDLCVVRGERMDHLVEDVRVLANTLIVFFRV